MENGKEPLVDLDVSFHFPCLQSLLLMLLQSSGILISQNG
jgi:hypothetical protein